MFELHHIRVLPSLVSCQPTQLHSQWWFSNGIASTSVGYWSRTLRFKEIIAGCTPFFGQNMKKMQKVIRCNYFSSVALHARQLKLGEGGWLEVTEYITLQSIDSLTPTDLIWTSVQRIVNSFQKYGHYRRFVLLIPNACQICGLILKVFLQRDLPKLG